MKRFWEQSYKSVAIELATAIPTTEKPQNEFEAWMQDSNIQMNSVDELELYSSQSVLPNVENPRSWWLDPLQQKLYPNLSKMAIDILSIPAMSAEPERLFSGAKLTITDQRNRMQPDTIEATQCLKSWYRNSALRK